MIVDQFDNLIKETQESVNHLTGILTISAPRTFGQTILAKYIPIFMSNHPNIKVTIKLSNKYQDLINQQIDLAIRTQPIVDKMLISEPLGYKRKGLFVSPNLINDLSKIKTPMDIYKYLCLAHTDFKDFDLWKLRSDNIRVSPYLA